MILGAFEALLSYIGSQRSMTHKLANFQFGQCRTAKNVSATCWSVAEAAQRSQSQL
jgi:hypothetical protein